MMSQGQTAPPSLPSSSINSCQKSCLLGTSCIFFSYKVKLELDCISNRERSLLDKVLDIDSQRTSRAYTIALRQICKIS